MATAKPAADTPTPAVAKQDSLTPEQRVIALEYRDRGIACSLNTDPIDKPKAIRSVKTCYEKSGHKPPSLFLFAANPGVAVFMAAVATKLQLANEIKDFAIPKSVYNNAYAAAGV